MRTYEITLTVQQTVTRTITSEKVETHDTLTEAALILEGLDGASLVSSHVVDKTPKPKTDKQRFNDAFRELRKLGYDARQGLTPLDGDIDVYTMREDAAWAFRSTGELVGMVPVNWDYDEAGKQPFHKKRVEILRNVFEAHGFDVTWDGHYWNCIEIRRGGGEL